MDIQQALKATDGDIKNSGYLDNEVQEAIQVLRQAASEPSQLERELSPHAKQMAELLAGQIVVMSNALAGAIVHTAQNKAADKIADDSG